MKYDNHNIDFTIEIKKNIKHTYISIHREKGIVIKGHNISLDRAKQLILSKAEWIIKKSEDAKKRQEQIDMVKQSNLANNYAVRFLGVNYQLDFVNTNLSKATLNFTGDKFVVKINNEIKIKNEIIELLVDNFYREASINHIMPLINYYSSIMKLYPKEIKFRKVKKRWGSCSHDDKISLNLNICQLNQEQASYIIIHELAHIKEKNHSKNFWLLIEKYLPDYKRLHKEILSFVF
ncbi:MAG: DUF45 domain-containing protein [Candidatus Sericytochromatia bacterium]|nr:DUF45 domain-containing protein [Candidatus Sericytochromatia bacterium]